MATRWEVPENARFTPNEVESRLPPPSVMASPVSEHTVRLHKPTASAMVGMTLAMFTRDDGVSETLPRIHHLHDSGLALASGLLKLDDILVSVNGRNAENDVVSSRLIREARGDVILKVRRQAVTTSGFIVTLTKPDPKMRLGIILASSPAAPDGTPMPPRIYRLEPDGLAIASRELFPGDMISAVNGQRVTTEEHAKLLIAEAGAVVALTITRPQTQEAAGKPGAPVPLAQRKVVEMPKQAQVRTEGQTLHINLSVPRGERLGVGVTAATGGGVTVDELVRGSVGESCGVIHAGDIILAVDDVLVSTEKEARRLLGNVASAGEVKLTVLASDVKPVKPVAAFWG